MNEVISSGTVEKTAEGDGIEDVGGDYPGGWPGKAFLRRYSGRISGSVQSPRLGSGWHLG